MISVRADTFPAELIIDLDAPSPEDRVRVYPVRVVVTSDEILVLKDASPRPELVFRDLVLSYSQATPPHRLTRAQRKQEPLHEFSIVTTDSGHVLAFRRASGCGCGSRLKVLSLQALLDMYPDPRTQDGAAVAVASTKDFQ